MPDEEDEDLQAVADAVLRDEDGYLPPEEMTVEPAPAKNLVAELALLKMGQKLKLALCGNRDVRTILMRDHSVIIQRMLVENPRLTEEEVIAMSKNRSLDAEVLTRISKKQEWVRNYQVRHALVTNPKTPMPVAIRFVSTLVDRDLRQLAKSRNVPSAVASTARRIILGRA